jgi:hypothetical protein
MGPPFEALRYIILKNEMKKKKPCPTIKSIYFSIGNGFFLKHSNYYLSLND